METKCITITVDSVDLTFAATKSRALAFHAPEGTYHFAHAHPSTHFHFTSGMFSFGTKPLSSSQYADFERAWYMQPSSATMSPNGSRTACSDAVDATGHYIWREDGREDGRCCGIDFQQAGDKWRAGKYSRDDPICASAAISTYVPFAYDATIALAHGLHKLLDEGVGPNDISADQLFGAIRQSTFSGVSGTVSFLDNGDRRESDLEYIVYNYHASTHYFEAVGQIVDGTFTRCSEGEKCSDMVFSDGKNHPPDVQRSVSVHNLLCASLNAFFFISCVQLELILSVICGMC